MELRRLRYFVRVAEDGSLTRSAGILRIAQSALTRQMRLLEEELGVRLFTRNARGMALTAEGEQLRALVAGPLREMELALASIRSAGAADRAPLVIGLPPGLAELLGAELSATLARDLPRLAVNIVEGPTGSLVDWLNRGVVDIALLEDGARDRRIAEEAIHEDPLWLVGPPGGPDAPVPFAALAGLPLVVPAHHLGMRAAIEEAAARAGATLALHLQADAPWLVRALVARGEGHGILPRAYCRGDVAEGRLGARAIVDPVPMIAIHLATRRQRPGAPANLRVALDIVRAIAIERLAAPLPDGSEAR